MLACHPSGKSRFIRELYPNRGYVKVRTLDRQHIWILLLESQFLAVEQLEPSTQEVEFHPRTVFSEDSTSWAEGTRPHASHTTQSSAWSSTTE